MIKTKTIDPTKPAANVQRTTKTKGACWPASKKTFVPTKSFVFPPQLVGYCF